MIKFLSMKSFLLLLAFLCCTLVNTQASNNNDNSLLLIEFDKWASEFGRSYNSDSEKSERFNVFKANYKYIRSKNSEPGLSYTLGLNEFADLTNEEFASRYTTPVLPANTFSEMTKMTRSEYLKFHNLSAAESKDWRDYGAVTPVKTQGTCTGGGWAFSAVAAIETATKIKLGVLLDLSEQELIDCVASSYPCDGGWPEAAYAWVKRNKGIATQAQYPYTGTSNSCDAQRASNHAVTVMGYLDLSSIKETSLKIAVSIQPVSVMIESTSRSFQFYKSGIYTGPCGTNLDHFLTIIGYGVASDGMKYWIAKNSWGTSWGVGGYLYIQREAPNKPTGLCGFTTVVSAPRVMQASALSYE